MFGEQKGADASARLLLDEALVRWSALLREATGTDVDIPGAGAAGGFPSAFLAFTGATLESGFDVISRLTGLDAALAKADLVLTGEGSWTNSPGTERLRCPWPSVPVTPAFRWSPSPGGSPFRRMSWRNTGWWQPSASWTWWLTRRTR